MLSTAITEPYVIRLKPYGDTVDLSDTEILSSKAMLSTVIIEPANGEFAMEARVTIGLVNPARVAAHGLWVWGISDSIIDVRCVRGAKENGVVIEQRGSRGTFNNFITINSIRHNGANGLFIRSPDSGVLGVQGNHFKIGQIIFCEHSGIAVFGNESAWNHFQVGPIEHNGMHGIYDGAARPGTNTWHIVDSNNNKFPDYFRNA